MEQKRSLFSSVKTRLIGAVSLLVAIPLIASSLISLVMTGIHTEETIGTLNESQMQTVQATFSQVVESNYSLTQAVANSAEVQQMLLGNLDADFVKGWFEAIDAECGDENALILINADGMQVLRTSGECVDVSDRDYYKKVKSGARFYVSDLNISKTSGERITTFVHAVYGPDGSFIGAIQRNYNLDGLTSVAKSMVTEAKQDIFICDNNGDIIVHSSIDLSTTPLNMSDRDWFIRSQQSMDSFETFQYEHDGAIQVVSYQRDPTTGWVTVVTRDRSTGMAYAYRTAFITAGIGIVMLAIAIFITYILAKGVTDPIKGINESLGQLAEGRFVFVDDKYVNRKDEFGTMAAGSNTVLKKLKDAMTNIKSLSGTVAQQAGNLSDISNQISHTAEDVSNSVQEIATGATQQADEIQNASTNVGYIGDAVLDVQDSSGNLKTLADKMKEASEVSSASLTELQSSSNDMTSKIDDIAETIGATQDAVSNISEKVEGITSIATQTNLLSLNASIEAARAGDAGKGFAVVAEEIGKLAEDSKRMADDIKVEMNTLLEKAQSAVNAASEVKDANLEQQSSLGETIEAINGMLVDINDTVGGVGAISRGAEQCDSSKNVVVDTMSALSAISEENAASAETTGAAMQELSATVTTLAGSANDLKGVSEELSEEVSFFDV